MWNASWKCAGQYTTAKVRDLKFDGSSFPGGFWKRMVHVLAEITASKIGQD
jgi:hypothetical protein